MLRKFGEIIKLKISVGTDTNCDQFNMKALFGKQEK